MYFFISERWNIIILCMFAKNKQFKLLFNINRLLFNDLKYQINNGYDEEKVAKF